MFASDATPAHSVSTGSESRSSGSVVADRFKTKMCHAFETTGHCTYGHRCMFAHGAHELRSRQQNEAEGIVNENSVYALRRRMARQAKRVAVTGGYPNPPAAPTMPTMANVPADPAAVPYAVAPNQAATPAYLPPPPAGLPMAFHIAPAGPNAAFGAPAPHPVVFPTAAVPAMPPPQNMVMAQPVQLPPGAALPAGAVPLFMPPS